MRIIRKTADSPSAPMNTMGLSIKCNPIRTVLIQPSLTSPVFQSIATAVGVMAMGIMEMNIKSLELLNFLDRSTAKRSARKY